jgi:hypothetical protein
VIRSRGIDPSRKPARRTERSLLRMKGARSGFYFESRERSRLISAWRFDLQPDSSRPSSCRRSFAPIPPSRQIPENAAPTRLTRLVNSRLSRLHLLHDVSTRSLKPRTLLAILIKPSVSHSLLSHLPARLICREYVLNFTYFIADACQGHGMDLTLAMHRARTRAVRSSLQAN